MKKIMFSFIVILMGMTLISCSEEDTNNNNNNPNSLNNSNYLTVSDTAFDIEVNYSDKEKLTVSKAELDDYDNVIKLSNKTVTITESEEYVLEGDIDDGQVIVDVPDSDTKAVTLILNGITVTSKESAAIYVKNAKKVILTLVDGTTSIISDGENYRSSGEDNEPNGCIFSKSDLVISGNGCLSVHANYNNGIVSKDDLTITGGKIGVVAKNNGIKGKDSIAILNGEIIICSDGDGMKSDNDKDKEKGFILIEGGIIEIDAKEDAIQAATCMDIRGGEILINAGDDGIHAEDTLIIKGGVINVEKSEEGIEATYIVIEDGDINVTSSDDGINAAGGNDSNANNNGPGNPFFDTGVGGITINDGGIYIYSSGDGLDSNGHITVNGGVVTVDGPSDGGNGAIDYGTGCIVNGGYIRAVGNSNMAQMPTETTVNSVMIGLNNNVKNGETIKILDSNGEEVLTFEVKKPFNNIVLCTEELKTGETYVLEIEGKEEVSFEISDKITTAGKVNTGGPGMGNVIKIREYEFMSRYVQTNISVLFFEKFYKFRKKVLDK